MKEKKKKNSMKEQLQEKKVCRTMLIENMKKDAWWYDEVKVAVDEKKYMQHNVYKLRLLKDIMEGREIICFSRNKKKCFGSQ